MLSFLIELCIHYPQKINELMKKYFTIVFMMKNYLKKNFWLSIITKLE